MKHTAQEIDQAAKLVTAWIVDGFKRDIFPKGIIENDDMVLESGLTPPPDVAPRQEHDDWKLDWMQVRELVRAQVTIEIGRYPRTVPGVGFRLLDPAANIFYAEEQAYLQAIKAMKKGAFILHHTRDADLSSSDRNAKLAAQNRLAFVQQIARTKLADAERAEKQRQRRAKAAQKAASAPNPLVTTPPKP